MFTSFYVPAAYDRIPFHFFCKGNLNEVVESSCHFLLSKSFIMIREGEWCVFNYCSPFWYSQFCFGFICGGISFLQIGQGTYSSVYKARDVIHDKIVALKKVRFDNLDIESVKFMAREIIILRRLDHPNIIKLEGLITSQMSRSLYLVFEYMEHDLTGLASRPGIKFSEPQVPYNGY
jgi:hypothetical protein